MTPLVRDLNARYNPDLMVAIADSCTFGAVLYREGILETSTELHAGEGETSQMLAIAPETVHMEQAVDFVPDVPRSYLNYGSIFRATPSGVWGEATKGSAQKGEMILERSARLAAEEFEKAFAYMSGKERINYSDF